MWKYLFSCAILQMQGFSGTGLPPPEIIQMSAVCRRKKMTDRGQVYD